MKKEYRVFNLVKEYGHQLNGCKYAVASDLPEEELRCKYCEELQPYEPFLYITWAMGNAIVTSQSNNSKYRKRRKKELQGGYLESGSERYISKILAVTEPTDPMEILIEQEEEQIHLIKILGWKRELPAAIRSLTEKQRSRLIMHYYEQLSFREIAERDGVSHVMVRKSVRAAEKKLEKFLKLGVTRPVDFSHISRGAF